MPDGNDIQTARGRDHGASELALNRQVQQWLAHLTAWRQTLCNELLAIKSPIRDAHLLGVRRNLELSILTLLANVQMRPRPNV